jgi:hypothetical protein
MCRARRQLPVRPGRSLGKSRLCRMSEAVNGRSCCCRMKPQPGHERLCQVGGVDVLHMARHCSRMLPCRAPGLGPWTLKSSSLLPYLSRGGRVRRLLLLIVSLPQCQRPATSAPPCARLARPRSFSKHARASLAALPAASLAKPGHQSRSRSRAAARGQRLFNTNLRCRF